MSVMSLPLPCDEFLSVRLPMKRIIPNRNETSYLALQIAHARKQVAESRVCKMTGAEKPEIKNIPLADFRIEEFSRRLVILRPPEIDKRIHP